MQINPATLFIVILTSSIFIEGTGFNGARVLSYYLIVFAVPILFLVNLKYGKKINVPKYPTILFALFWLFSLISTIYGLNPAESFTVLLFYLAGYLYLIFAYNYKGELGKYIQPTIIFISLTLITLSLVINNINWIDRLIQPLEDRQFVYSAYGSHNHLGDFLALALICLIYQLFRKHKIWHYIMFGLIILPFFLLSYSRSAYNSLILPALLLVYNQRRNVKFKIALIPLVVILISTIFLSAVTNLRYFGNLNLLLKNNFALQDKELGLKRAEFARQGFESINKRPLLGLGPANFIYASKKYTKIREWTNTTHNLFLDILVENGFLAFIPFALLIGVVIFKAFKKILVESLLFLAMLINFQTDYTFLIYSHLLLFFILMGMVLQSKPRKT